MSFEKVKGTPFDYSNDKVHVYFEVADKIQAKIRMESISYINEIEELEHGFSIKIAIQQIPEVVRYLTYENIAIYAVVPRK